MRAASGPVDRRPLGTAPDRSSLVPPAVRLILEEALEGEVRNRIEGALRGLPSFVDYLGGAGA
jgi:hypothetical protein